MLDALRGRGEWRSEQAFKAQLELEKGCSAPDDAQGQGREGIHSVRHSV